MSAHRETLRAWDSTACTFPFSVTRTLYPLINILPATGYWLLRTLTTDLNSGLSAMLFEMLVLPINIACCFTFSVIVWSTF